jgi:hypothetical protein
VLAGAIRELKRSVDALTIEGALLDVYAEERYRQEQDAGNLQQASHFQTFALGEDCLIMRECKIEKTVSYIVGVAIAPNVDTSTKSTKLLEKHKFLNMKTSKGRLALAANSFFLLWLMITCSSALLLVSTIVQPDCIDHW